MKKSENYSKFVANIVYSRIIFCIIVILTEKYGNIGQN